MNRLEKARWAAVVIGLTGLLVSLKLMATEIWVVLPVADEKYGVMARFMPTAVWVVFLAMNLALFAVAWGMFTGFRSGRAGPLHAGVVGLAVVLLWAWHRLSIQPNWLVVGLACAVMLVPSAARVVASKLAMSKN